jgi:hypothetical protein
MEQVHFQKLQPPKKIEGFAFLLFLSHRLYAECCYSWATYWPLGKRSDAGVDAFTLAAIFGWSDIRTTMRYTHAMQRESHVKAITVGANRTTPEG